MSFWDFDWAKNTVNATAKWIDRAFSRVTPDIIEKPLTYTTKSVNDYLLKPVIRPALVISHKITMKLWNLALALMLAAAADQEVAVRTLLKHKARANRCGRCG